MALAAKVCTFRLKGGKGGAAPTPLDWTHVDSTSARVQELRLSKSVILEHLGALDSAGFLAQDAPRARD